MNKILKLRNIIFIVLVIITLILSLGNNVKAVIDETRKVSLTIKKYEHSNGGEDNIPLKGVEFSISLVPNEIEFVEDAESYIKNNEITSYKKTTPESGIITFENLEQGRYFVQEINAPKNVVSKVESFLIDLPRTNNNGNGLDYDVTVYPKNITIYGTVTLNQLTQNGQKLQGTVWELQKLNVDNQWEKYDYQGELTTNQDGLIIIQNLEVGKYRLLQEKTLEGYILDQTNSIEFEINFSNIDYQFTSVNETLTVQKQVLKDDGNYGDSQGAFKTDINSWKVTADIANIITKMNNYKIKDELPDGLNYLVDSIEVYGINKDNEQIKVSDKIYTKNINDNILEINFDTKKLNEYKSIIVKYDTEFDNKISYGEFKNKVYLTYTNHIDEEGNSKSDYTSLSEAEVHTGGVLIYKTDEYNNPLPGATFKIAVSKEKANDNVFIKDKNGDDVEETSDKNGYVLFEGLKYNNVDSYWIVEVQAPSYQEEGEIKYYNLLEKPVKVNVDSTSQNYSEENTTVVINKKPFTLPLTGGTLSIISSVLGLFIIFLVIIINKRKKKCKKQL